MDTKAAAAEIRKGLKAAGWTSRDVSVRIDSYSMGSSIYVIVKNLAVPMALVHQLAAPHESVRRDESTGEILSGGNTYLHVEYSSDAIAPLVAEVLAKIPQDGTAADVAGWNVYRETGNGEHYYRATRPGSRKIHCWGVEFCARQIVEENLRREHLPRVTVKADCVEVAS